jgi:hypothetical protein
VQELEGQRGHLDRPVHITKVAARILSANPFQLIQLGGQAVGARSDQMPVTTMSLFQMDLATFQEPSG